MQLADLKYSKIVNMTERINGEKQQNLLHIDSRVWRLVEKLLLFFVDVDFVVGKGILYDLFE